MDTVTAKPRVTQIEESTFETKRENGQMREDERYKIIDRHGNVTMYAWTVDGEGFVFYDTLEELREDVG
jgi:hypothetical protein